MRELIETLHSQVEKFNITNAKELEDFRIQYLGSKGAIKELFGKLKEVPNEQKREVGQLVNQLRNFAEERFNVLK